MFNVIITISLKYNQFLTLYLFKTLDKHQVHISKFLLKLWLNCYVDHLVLEKDYNKKLPKWLFVCLTKFKYNTTSLSGPFQQVQKFNVECDINRNLYSWKTFLWTQQTLNTFEHFLIFQLLFYILSLLTKYDISCCFLPFYNGLRS